VAQLAEQLPNRAMFVLPTTPRGGLVLQQISKLRDRHTCVANNATDGMRVDGIVSWDLTIRTPSVMPAAILGSQLSPEL
jgi:hypothetical protein